LDAKATSHNSANQPVESWTSVTGTDVGKKKFKRGWRKKRELPETRRQKAVLLPTEKKRRDLVEKGV